MHFYISAKRVTISSCRGGCFWEVMKVKGTNRRFSYRSVLPSVLIVGVLLPFIFIRAAFLALDGTSKCSSTFNCIGLGWRLGPGFLRGTDTSKRLGDELARALLEAKEEVHESGGLEFDDVSSLHSFNDLVADVTSHRHDIKAFAFKTKQMLMKMERKVRAAKLQGSIYRHLASIGVPKSMHCLCLKLAEEYSVNALARSPLPPPEFIHRITDTTHRHFAILTDNILAASVVVSSAVRNCRQPEKIVFHVVTDKKTYAAMHAWFALHPVMPAVVEVKGLHKYDWPTNVNYGLMEMTEIHRALRDHYYYFGGDYGKLQALRPSCTSLLNYIRIYLPELFPELERIILLDDDVVVQHDLTPLWELDLNGKVNGAVGMWSGDGESSYCLARTFGEYLNFSYSIISSEFEPDQCAWLYGMNVFDLQAWRRTNITQTYRRWLKHNVDTGFSLWHLGALPPALIAFAGHIHHIDPTWHMAGLGYQLFNADRAKLEAAAILHFSGPAKPWLAIGFPELRTLWSRHVNFSNEFITSCRIME